MSSIHALSEQRFRALLRISRSSIASPPWFASPIDAEEDEDAITVVFHVPPVRGDVRVEATDQSVTVWGRSREMRLCALPCAIVASDIKTVRAGDLLRVRVRKRRPAADSTDSSASPTQT